jgi:hypothetical protein
MTTMRAAALAGLVQALAVVAMLSCVTPLPPTPIPTPVADAGTVDANPDKFINVTIDCAEEVPNPPTEDVRTCLEVSNTSSCMSDLVVGTRTADVVGCTARNYGMILFVKIERGTATDIEKFEAASYNYWIKAHGISVRE